MTKTIVNGTQARIVTRYTLVPAGVVIAAVLLTITVMRATDTRISLLERDCQAAGMDQQDAEVDLGAMAKSIAKQDDRLNTMSKQLALILYRLDQLQRATGQPPGGS